MHAAFFKPSRPITPSHPLRNLITPLALISSKQLMQFQTILILQSHKIYKKPYKPWRKKIERFFDLFGNPFFLHGLTGNFNKSIEPCFPPLDILSKNNPCPKR